MAESIAAVRLDLPGRSHRRPDCDAQTAVERELVLRLASLLWRRATAIETALFKIQADAGCEPSGAPQCQGILNAGSQATDEAEATADPSNWCGHQIHYLVPRTDETPRAQRVSTPWPEPNCQIARCFSRNGSVERLGRYETALWRQVYQVIFMLDVLGRQNLDTKWLPRQMRRSERFRPPRPIFTKP